MAQKGQAGLAVGLSTISSVFGGIFSTLALMLFAPSLASYALRFGPAEYFALGVFGLSTVAGMSGKNLLKNLIVCVLGLLLATMGMSPQTGFPRYDFGSDFLLEGIPLISALIGLFGVSSVFHLVERIARTSARNVKPLSIPSVGKTMPSWAMVKRLMPAWLTGSTVGTIIGIIPGAGMIMAIYLAYDLVKARYKKLVFGTGVPEGIAAPESANNAVVAGSMVPLLSLGVPGNSTSALFLGALMIQGMRPGPALFREHPDMAYLIIVGFFIANIIMGPIGLALGRFLAKLVFRIPQTLMTTTVVLLCITGAFSVGNHVFHIWVALIFGCLGYIMDKTALPQGPLILALILGPMIETGYEQSLAMSMGSHMIFLKSPICLVMLSVSVIFCLIPVFSKVKQAKILNLE
jgi:putative tricarboxylic transport membrane protein